MVKKLLKHEFIYYFRTFSIFVPIVLIVAAMTRVFFLFDTSNPIVSIVAFSSSLLLYLACMALLLMATVVCIVRFYKNMYATEGYLTLTLPVSHTQHILVKLISAIAVQAIAVLTVFAAVCIALAGQSLGLLFEGFGALFADIAKLIGGGNLAGYIIEFVLLIIVCSAESMLLFYGCITVGQMAKKNRVLMAFVSFFVYYLGSQIVGTILLIIFYILGRTTTLPAQLLAWAVENLAAAMHLYLCGMLLICAGLGVLFFFITRSIMKKKLNLE